MYYFKWFQSGDRSGRSSIVKEGSLSKVQGSEGKNSIVHLTTAGLSGINPEKQLSRELFHCKFHQSTIEKLHCVQAAAEYLALIMTAKKCYLMENCMS